MPEKPQFYAFSRRDFWRKNFRKKFIAARPDDPIGLIFGTYAPTYIYNNSMDWIWLIFIFGWDMGSFVDQEGLFLLFFMIFSEKRPSWSTNDPIS